MSEATVLLTISQPLPLKALFTSQRIVWAVTIVSQLL